MGVYESCSSCGRSITSDGLCSECAEYIDSLQTDNDYWLTAFASIYKMYAIDSRGGITQSAVRDVYDNLPDHLVKKILKKLGDE